MPNAHLRVQHGWCNSSGSLKGTVMEKMLPMGMLKKNKIQILNQCALELLANVYSKSLVKKMFPFLQTLNIHNVYMPICETTYT